MAYNFDLGFSPSAMTAKNVDIDTIDSTAYVKTGESLDSVNYTCRSSSLGRPETLSFGKRPIKDIYASSSIESAYRCPSKAGIKILVTSSTVASLTETDTPSFRYDFPITVKTVIDVPASDYMTSDQVLDVIKHHWGALFEGGTDVTSARITELLRGALELDN